MIYKLFKKSLEDQVFLEPATQCSEAYYQLLMAEPRMKRLHSTITRNYAAALQEEAQQTLNFWLKVNLTKNMQPGSNQKTEIPCQNLFAVQQRNPAAKRDERTEGDKILASPQPHN